MAFNLDFIKLYEIDQFTFYRIPKLLFTEEAFRLLSDGAKILYGILLDRVSLSKKNGWTDDRNRVYIIYTIEEIIEDLNCGNKKAGQLLQELEKVGLIEKKRRGLGKPNLLYVKHIIPVECTPASEDTKEQSLKCQNDTSRNGKTTPAEVSRRHCSNNNTNKTEKSKINSFPSGKTTGTEPETMQLRQQYEEYFNQQLEMNCLKLDWSLDQETLTAMYDLLVDVCSSKRRSIRINREDMPLEVVKSRFMKLRPDHIRYSIMTLSKVTTKITDMKQYMLAVLYNAPTTISAFYQNLVQHDLEYGPEGGDE